LAYSLYIAIIASDVNKKKEKKFFRPNTYIAVGVDTQHELLARDKQNNCSCSGVLGKENPWHGRRLRQG
tara:strand:- start:474 stop:680 length:207 start_codon:yes stop_codon:yes gene_type:complete